MKLSELYTSFRQSICLIAFIGFAFAGVTFGQGGAERIFDEANILYQQQDYAASLEKYLQIESQNRASGPLYYNIGNCYYKLGQIGRAILYYERARRLDPGDEDLKANLEIANQATIDRISVPAEFALAQWLRSSLYLFTRSTLLRVLMVAYLISGVLLVLLIVSRRPEWRSRFRRGLTVALLLTFCCGLLAGIQAWDSYRRVEAVVQASEVTAMSSPGDGAVEVFQIHEGTKIRIDQKTDGWVEIVLPDGKVGWIPEESAEII